MNNVKKPPGRGIFPRGTKIAGERIVNEHFTGSAWLEMLVPDDRTFNCPIGNVTFEPGSRNNWHKHPGGQILLVTSGKGYSQEEGGKVRILHPGDVVTVPPEVKHWHGAAPDSWFTHIAVMPNTQKGDAEWLEPVNDEEYSVIEE